MQFTERDLTAAELARVHLGFDEHARQYNNVAPPRTRHGFVATCGDSFVGCATGLRDNRWYYLSDLWVADAYRGRGIGRQLLSLWERRLALEGVKDVYTWTAGFQAPGFYQKQGWDIFVEFSGFYANGHSRLGLRKALTSTNIS